MAGRDQSRRQAIEAMLEPGGGAATYRHATEARELHSAARWFAYALLSSISSAIRERAVDQSRSTERSDVSSASAVSAVVKPAK